MDDTINLIENEEPSQTEMTNQHESSDIDESKDEMCSDTSISKHISLNIGLDNFTTHSLYGSNARTIQLKTSVDNEMEFTNTSHDQASITLCQNDGNTNDAIRDSVQNIPISCDPVSIGDLRTAYKNGCDPLTPFKAYVRSGLLKKLLEDTDIRFERYEYPQIRKSYTFLAPPGKLGIILSPEGGIVLGHTTSNSIMQDKIPSGAQIIAVDNVDVCNLTSIEIHKLLASKADCQRRLKIRKLKIAHTKYIIPSKWWEPINLISSSRGGYHETENRIQHILEDQAIKDSDTVALVFHGTHHSNNDSILESGLDPALRNRQKRGEGEYFSRDPSLCIPYCGSGNCMLVFLVIDSSAKKCSMKGERIPSSCVIVKEPLHQFPFGVLHYTHIERNRKDEPKKQRQRPPNLYKKGSRKKLKRGKKVGKKVATLDLDLFDVEDESVRKKDRRKSSGKAVKTAQKAIKNSGCRKAHFISIMSRYPRWCPTF